MEVSKKIAALGCMCGITAQYWDNFGCRHRTSQTAYRALLSAMRVPWEDLEILDQEIARRRLGPWASLVEPVQLISPESPAPQAILRVWSGSSEPLAVVEVQGELVSETGERYHWEKQLLPGEPLPRHAVPGGARVALSLPLPPNLAMGYYNLSLKVRSGGREETGRTRLIAAPSQAYVPEWLEKGRRLWGVNLPLYALRSSGNWGMGDFGDLMAVTRWAGTLGAGFVGVNPLHAPGLRVNDDPSPYSPSSRVFLNWMYLNLEAAPEMADCREAQDLLAGPEFLACKMSLTDTNLVPYREIFRWKRQVLELLYQTFRSLHGDPENPRTSRGEEFAGFVAAKGEALAGFSRFSALADHFQEDDWRRWPEPYRSLDRPAVAAFAREHPKEIGLFQYGQWLAEAQLNQVCQAAREQGLPFTLYEDLALGSSPGGFDTWAHQKVFALGAAMGAPADAFNPKGQNWGLPPLIPEDLRASGYQLFIDTLQANLPRGGMTRIDHVMGLFRLFWIPRGEDASLGAYVRYPEKELLAILALESVRRQALIIGEDLGTVPPHIRRDLGKLRVFSYRVFYFERDGNHNFLPPEAYPVQAMAAVTTHDLPTLKGFWRGDDLVLKRKLNLYPSGSMAENDAITRDGDRRLLIEALRSRGLLPAGPPLAPGNNNTSNLDLREAVLTYLGQTRTALLEVRLEEIFGMAEQQNLPGTRQEHPNWRLKLPLTLEQMIQAPEPARIAARLNEARRESLTADH
ncbi:MAG: 4-alpha-glucanotransferase [Thermodesulfobacteriota bacterium]